MSHQNECCFYRSAEAVMDYEAPELFEECAFNLMKCDIWALGVMLYRLMTGEYPFTNQNLQIKGTNHIDRYKRAILEFHSRKHLAYPPDMDDGCVDLIKRCLEQRPSARISIEEIFEHEWFAVDFPHEARMMNMQIISDMRKGILSGSAGGEISIKRTVLDAYQNHQGDSTERYIDQVISSERETNSVNVNAVSTRPNIYHSENSGSG